MNTLGNVGSAISPALLAYVVGLHGWNLPFVISSVLCIAAAALFSQIDATRKIGADYAARR
jgi:MFS family permease